MERQYLTEDMPKDSKPVPGDGVTVKPGEKVVMTVQRTAKGLEVSGEAVEGEEIEEGKDSKPQLLTEG